MYTLSRDTWTTKNMVKISVLGVISMGLDVFWGISIFCTTFFKIRHIRFTISNRSLCNGTNGWSDSSIFKEHIECLNWGFYNGRSRRILLLFSWKYIWYVAGCIYYRKKTFKSAIIGLILGVLSMTLFDTLSNYFVVFPLYAKIFGWALDKLVSMGSAVDKFVIDYKSLILFAVVPFNILNGIIVSLVTILIYKKVSPILHK